MKITCEHCHQEMEIKLGALMRQRAMDTTTTEQRTLSAKNAGIASGKARQLKKALKELSPAKKKKVLQRT